MWAKGCRRHYPKRTGQARAKFPDACLHWFEDDGHFPQWNVPAEANRLILAVTSGQDWEAASATPAAAVPATAPRRLAVAAGIGAVLAVGAVLLRRGR